MRDAYQRSVALGAVLVAAGFVAIGVAWMGVADTVIIPTQVAYALSGGFGGLALLGTGIALLEVQRRRMAAAQDRRDLADFAAELGDVAELIAAAHAQPAPARRRRVLRAR
jgi:hypothetical protein